MRNKSCGQSITTHLCHSFFLTLFPCSSIGGQSKVLKKKKKKMKKKALVWAELHGLQFLQGMLICSSALQKMQGSLFSSAWSTSSLSFSDLGAHRAVSNFFFLLLLFFYFFFFFLISHCLCSVLHFPKYVFCKVTPVCLCSSAVVGLLELTGTGCVWPGGLPTEGPLACPPLPRAGHGHAVQ